MNNIVQTCRVSGAQFNIPEEDQKFLEKIAPIFKGKKYDFGLPTMSPLERMRRRHAFRNESTLHKIKCNATGKDIISMYSQEGGYIVYDNDSWWGGNWDALDYGEEYDFSCSFFEQFDELLKRTPKMARVQQGENENSKYTNCASYNKNCYLVFSANNNEDSLYMKWANRNTSCVDNFNIMNCEFAYNSVDCIGSYDIQHCQKTHNSSSMRYCYDCRNSQNCFACVGLRNQQGSYWILNEQVSKEQFEEVMSSFEKQNDVLQKLSALYLSIPRLYCNILQSTNCTGDYIHQCKNTFESWDVENLEDCKYCDFFQDAKDCYDVSFYGCTGTNELLYECEGVGHGVFQSAFCKLCWGGCNNIYYSYECFNCQNCFGCTGLKNKQYCIFNKQYSKEEYEILVPKIIEQMQLEGFYGEFFPMNISPFGYNETLAQEFFPETKEGVSSLQGKWIQYPEKNTGSESSEIMTCKKTQRPFRFVPQEKEFYEKMGVLLPTLHPDERHRQRFVRRNARRLYKRNCAKTGVELYSTYSPDRSEVIYSEDAYNEYLYN